MEDLWAFNDERVAYAIFESEIPVISAVGHEPDITISDFVADLRAATPSNAAELAVPDQAALRQNLDNMLSGMINTLTGRVDAAKKHLRVLAQSPVLRSPDAYLQQRRGNVELLRGKLVAAQNQILSRKNQKFVSLAAKLDAMSPLKVLSRGYAMAQTTDGAVIRSISQTKAGDTITVTLGDGKLHANVTDTKEAN